MKMLGREGRKRAIRDTDLYGTRDDSGFGFGALHRMCFARRGDTISEDSYSLYEIVIFPGLAECVRIYETHNTTIHDVEQWLYVIVKNLFLR